MAAPAKGDEERQNCNQGQRQRRREQAQHKIENPLAPALYAPLRAGV